MSERRTLLILTSKTGGGHISLAEALRDQLEQDYSVEIVDPQPAFIQVHYRLVSRYALWLWAAEFAFMDTPARSLSAHRLFTRFVSRPLHSLLDRVQPDMVITTYPFLTYEVTQVLQQRSASIPFVMLLSDANGVHASWLTEHNATATLAPTHETYEQALQVGIDSHRVHFVGWPVRGQFYRTTDSVREEVLTELGMDPSRFTIFLQGGGEGAAKFGKTVENILTSSNDIQIILATGTNAALLTRFSGRKNIHPLPFTRDIARYMAAADVIMGKAGPNMLFESVTLGKPFVATAYIPGQEEANLAFIQRYGLGWVALQSEEQRSLLHQLVTSDTEFQAMRASVERYRQENTAASKKIVPLIHSLLPVRASQPSTGV